MTEDIDEQWRREGYEKYITKDGKKYYSKGCPCCTNDKYEIIDLKEEK